MKPKGLRLFDRDTRDGYTSSLDLVGSDSYEVDGPTVTACACLGGTFLDADQLDKLAQRCKEWSKYLRSQKGKKPTVKKWEDL